MCQLQALCSQGFAQHVQALRETARVKAQLASGGDNRGALEALSSASRRLSDAAPLIARCVDAQGAAHRSYKF